MSIPSVAQTITRGKISAYLAGNDNSEGTLFGSRKASPGSIITITMVTNALSWGYDGGAQTAASLRSTANYLIWLCGQYGNEAEYISQGAGGGSVIPGGGSLLTPLDWVVGASSEPLATGETTCTLTDFIGYEVNFTRGGLPQYTTDPGDGSTYYSWSKATGIFTLLGTNPGAVLDEPMRIFI